MKRHWFWSAILLLLLASLLRFGALGAQEVSGDEAFSILFSKHPPKQTTAETLRLGEPHPPLYYFVLHGWMAVAGESEFSARFPSAAASTLAVALVFALTRRMFGWNAGLAAAAFMTINPFQMWYAQTARMYALSTALALSTTLALWAGLRRDRWQHWVTYLLLTTTHAFVHYVALLVALAQGFWVLLTSWRDWRRLLHFVLACLVAALLYLPWLALVLPSILAYHGNVDSPSLGAMLVRCLRVFGLGTTMQPTAAVPFVVAFGLLFALGLVRAARTNPRAAGLLTLWLFLPLLSMWIASRREPVFDERYVMAASPAFYIFLGLGAGGLARKRRWLTVTAGMLVTVCLVGTILSLKHYYAGVDDGRTRGWREAAAYLDTYATEDDILVQNYPDPSLRYYTADLLPLVVLPERYGAPPEQIEQTLTGLTEEHTRIWFLPYPHPAWDPTGAVGQWLERHADLADEEMLGDIRLQGYIPLRVALEQMSPVEAQLGSNVRLLGYRLEGEAQPGNTLQLTLYWEALGQSALDYTVFTHLVGPGAAMLGQMDHPPQNGAAPTSTWQPGQQLADRYEITVREDAPAGPARLLIGMYDPATEDRLPATGPVDELDRIYLTEVEIKPAP